MFNLFITDEVKKPRNNVKVAPKPVVKAQVNGKENGVKPKKKKAPTEDSPKFRFTNQQEFEDTAKKVKFHIS